MRPLTCEFVQESRGQVDAIADVDEVGEDDVAEGLAAVERATTRIARKTSPAWCAAARSGCATPNAASGRSRRINRRFALAVFAFSSQRDGPGLGGFWGLGAEAAPPARRRAGS